MKFMKIDGGEMKIKPQLRNAILEHSVSDKLSEAVAEWYISGYVCNEEMTGTCVCGQEKLKYEFRIKNGQNGNSLFPVGSSCIKKFGDKTDMAMNLEAIHCMCYALANNMIEMPSRKFFTYDSDSEKNYFSRLLIEYLVKLWLLSDGEFYISGFKSDFPKSSNNLFLSWFNGSQLDDFDCVRLREWYLFEGQAILCRMFDQKFKEEDVLLDVRCRLRGQYLKRLACEVMFYVNSHLHQLGFFGRWADADIGNEWRRFNICKELVKGIDRCAVPLPVVYFIAQNKQLAQFVEIPPYYAKRRYSQLQVFSENLQLLMHIFWNSNSAAFTTSSESSRYIFAWRDVFVPIFEAISLGQVEIEDMEDHIKMFQSRISGSTVRQSDACKVGRKRFEKYSALQAAANMETDIFS